MRALVAAILALFAVPQLAWSKTSEKPEKFSVQDFTCPLTGTAFKQEVGYFSFPLITMPDGSWLGDTEIGVQIPVCPDDGLVLLPDVDGSDQSKLVYHTYTAEERGKLGALIADPEYTALKADGPYSQAYWLATKLGRPGEDRFFMLQRATWATTDPELRRKLVSRLAANGEAVIAAYRSGENIKRFHLVYVAGALRELGRFDEATVLLDRIESSGPPVLKPDDPDSIYGPGEFAPELRLAITEKDDGRFPAAMLPGKMVDDICEDQLTGLYGPTGAATKAACRARREREERESTESEQAYTESADWRERPAERDRICLATPAAGRSRGLAMACDDAQRARDQLAGLELAKQPEQLATACAATPPDARPGPLDNACDDFGTAVGDQLGDLLALDQQGYALICDVGDPEIAPSDRSREANFGCRRAGAKRKTFAVERLQADLPALDARCKAYGDSYDDEVLTDACREREWGLQNQAAEALAREPGAFDRRCGRFRSKMKDNWITRSDEEFVCRTAWEIRRDRTTAAVIPPPVLEDAMDPYGISSRRLDETRNNAPLQALAHQRAAEIVAQAKAEGTYPRLRPGERPF